jgi:hypothetical protein
MAKNKLKALVIAVFLVVVVCCNQMQQPGNNTNNASVKKFEAAEAACEALSGWVSNPQNPTEIPGGGNTICSFHQFSWQAFIALMNAPGTGDRAFQDEQNFPLLMGGDQNSCTPNSSQSQVFVRIAKDNDPTDDDFVLPKDINQAGKNVQATVYDQNGNVVFYEVRFSRSECTQDPKNPQFTDVNTTELKVSYRVIKETEKPNYIWIKADINGDGKIDEKELLGMVGFHLVKGTKDHPEFIWASFEHKQNTPDCQAPAASNATAWSFTSAKCASELPNSVASDCAFNAAQNNTVLSGGPPTQICKAYHDGSKKGDFVFDVNVAAIDALNTQLTGPSGFISGLPASNPLSVLKNYELIGTLWLKDVNNPSRTPGQPPGDTSNQVGSLQLANSTMETTFQEADVSTGTAVAVPYTGTANLKNAANCFFCHGYTPNNNVTLSHIFSGILGKKQ